MGCWLGVAGSLALPLASVKAIERASRAISAPVVNATLGATQRGRMNARAPSAPATPVKAPAGPSAQARAPLGVTAVLARARAPLAVRVARRVAFVSFFLLTLPACVLAFCALFGAIVGAAEGWAFRDGFLYVFSNTLGLPNPLTQVSPTSDGGMAFSILVGTLAIISISTLMGSVGLFVLMRELFGDGAPGEDDELEP